MKKFQLIVMAAFFAAGILQAAGAVKTYSEEAAFAPDDAVEWTTLAATHRATSVTGSVTVSGNFNGGSGPLVLSFSDPVMGVAVQLHANSAVPVSGRLAAFDAAGNLVGSSNVTVQADAPFVGLRSSLKEIVRVEIASPDAQGYTIGGFRLALNSVIDNNTFFVNQLFQDLFGRAPTAAELQAKLDALKQGTATRVQTAATLFASPEFHDNAGFLVKCYVALLDHDPDFERWLQILNLMQKGATQEDALAAFMTTPEYAAVYPASMRDNDFVTRLHQTLLGRNPEANELESWGIRLEQGVARREMVETLMRGAEFEGRISGRVNTSLACLAFLRHGAEPTAMGRWSSKFQSGASVTDLVADFISLPEYVGRF